MPPILAISGSLRRASSNTALLEAMAQLASDGLEVDIYRGLADLPPFNPDLDGDAPQANWGQARLGVGNWKLTRSTELWG